MPLKEHIVGGFLKLIGDAIRERRESKNLKQSAISRDAGVSLSTYNEMESGQRMYRIDAFIRVLDVFQLDIMRIFEAPRPRRENPGHELLHKQLDELLSAPPRWSQGIELNIISLHGNWKREPKQKNHQAGSK